MEESPDRKELERRLAQAKRMAASTGDIITVERLKSWWRNWKVSCGWRVLTGAPRHRSHSEAC